MPTRVKGSTRRKFGKYASGVLKQCNNKTIFDLLRLEYLYKHRNLRNLQRLRNLRHFRKSRNLRF